MTSHQTTGSITIDTDAFADAVAIRVRDLVGAPEPLTGDQAAAVLTEATRVGNQYSARFGHDVLIALTQAGYALVPLKSRAQREADWFAPGRTD